MNKRLKIIYIVISWLVVLGVMIVIMSFSLQNSTESSETSKGIMKLIPFYDKISEELISVFHTIIRKIAHFSIYALLGFCAYNAFCTSVPIKTGFVYLISVGFASSYAFIDEFVFQNITPGRAPMLFDVCIDTFGATFGASIMLLILLIIKKIKNKETSF